MISGHSRHTISSHLRAVAVAVACVIASVAAVPSAIAASFDGEWNVVVRTPDHCGTTQWGVVIAGGLVHHPDFVLVGGFPAFVGGQVSPTGEIVVNVWAGFRFASGTGRLGPRHGRGTWAGQGPSGTCAGTWTATRLTAPISAAFVRQ